MEQDMKLTNKTAGFGLMAVAVLLLGSAAIADSMAQMGPPVDGPMDGLMGGPGHGMVGMPSLADLDANKDGKVSKDEIAAFRKAETVSLDANGDGKLSVEELAARSLKQMTAAATVMAEHMVTARDTDGDGLLSAAEMAGPPVPPAMFERIDTNKDGFLDQAELDTAQRDMMDRGARQGGGWRGHGKHGMGHNGKADSNSGN
jgi:hypothetical protein